MLKALRTWGFGEILDGNKKKLKFNVVLKDVIHGQ